jgi:heptosyltransferase-3
MGGQTHAGRVMDSALQTRLHIRNHTITNIAVIKLRYIGDTMLITPVLDALRMAFPSAAITAVVNRGTEPVLVNNPSVDDIITIDRTAPQLKYAGDLQRIRRKQFDLAMDLTGADRSAFLAYWSRAPIRMGYRGGNLIRNHLFYNVLVDADALSMHKIDHHLAMVEAMGLPITNKIPRLFLTDEEINLSVDRLRERGVPSDRPFIVLHPGARRWYKSWPLDYFSQLGDRITQELSIPVVLAGGAGDTEAVRTIQKNMASSCINMAAQFNLRELAGLMKRASLCVVNDSAPMHLAAAVATPTVALFGLTDPKYWAPLGPNHLVLYRECPCRPYGHRRECPEGDNRCMSKISVDEVFESVQSVLYAKLNQTSS